MEYNDISRNMLWKDPAVDVPVIEIEFDHDEEPAKVRQRTYSPEKTDFLKHKVKELCDNGSIKLTNASN